MFRQIGVHGNTSSPRANPNGTAGFFLVELPHRAIVGWRTIAQADADESRMDGRKRGARSVNIGGGGVVDIGISQKETQARMTKSKMILDYLELRGWTTSKEITGAVQLASNTVHSLLRSLSSRGILAKRGSRSHYEYRVEKLAAALPGKR